MTNVPRSPHRRAKLAELCDLQNGNGFRPPQWRQNGLPIIRIQNLNGSRDFNYFDGEPDAKWLVEPGDLLFAWAGVKGVSFGPTVWNGPRGVLNQHIFRINPRAGVDRDWLFQALKLVTAHIEGRAHGFKASLVHVQKAEITEQMLDVPTLPEQRRIAALLKTWDDALDALDRLRTHLMDRRKALRRAVFAQTHAGDATQTLADVTTRITRGSDAGDHPLMTIASQSGFVLQSDKYARHMAGVSAESYTLLRRGEFAYNKGNSLTYPQGCVFRLDRDSALVPFVYFCFGLKEGLNSDYYAQLFAAGYLNAQLARMIKTGVRNNGLLNINADEFFACTVPVPSDNRQAADAAILNDADAEVRGVEAEIEQVKIQKRGLMQKLLTGEWRVPETVMAEVA